jgi:hypothetical protein
MFLPLKMRSRSLKPLSPAGAPVIHLGAAPIAASRTVAKVSTRALPPPHATSEDADRNSDLMILPGRTRRGARMAGVSPLLASHVPSSAAAEEVSTDRLSKRLLLGLRAPVVVPSGSVLWRP